MFKDNTIKIYNIKNNTYQVLQTLNYYYDEVNKIIELTNKKLISCSHDSSIIIYSKDNNKYIKESDIKTVGRCWCIIQTKENEICYNEPQNNSSICFYDLMKNKIINKINNIGVTNSQSFNMITKDLLLIYGRVKLYIINVNQHKLIRIMNVPDSSYFLTSCLLKKILFQLEMKIKK